jgi:hypothetical protein
VNEGGSGRQGETGSEPQALPPFERRLLDDLRAFREQLPPRREPATAGVSTRRIVLAVALTVAITGAAGGAIVYSVATGHRSSAPQTVKELRQRMLLALSGSDDRILYEHDVHSSFRSSGGGPMTLTPSGHTDSWEDLSTSRNLSIIYGEDGTIELESAGSSNGSTLRLDTVMYPSGIWETFSHTFSGTPPASQGNQGLSDLYRALVARGDFKIVGTSTIGGESVVELDRPFPSAISPPAAAKIPALTTRLWVDASTYLPVLQEITAGPAITSRTTYTWLPRTPENLKKLDLVVPPGFKHVTGDSSASTTFTNTWGGGSGTSTSGDSTVLTPSH